MKEKGTQVHRILKNKGLNPQKALPKKVKGFSKAQHLKSLQEEWQERGNCDQEGSLDCWERGTTEEEDPPNC